MPEFTYYCGEHRDQVATAAPPSTAHPSGGFVAVPCCPICYESMYWVPNGGTAIPERTDQ